MLTNEDGRFLPSKRLAREKVTAFQSLPNNKWARRHTPDLNSSHWPPEHPWGECCRATGGGGGWGGGALSPMLGLTSPGEHSAVTCSRRNSAARETPASFWQHFRKSAELSIPTVPWAFFLPSTGSRHPPRVGPVPRENNGKINGRPLRERNRRQLLTLLLFGSSTYFLSSVYLRGKSVSKICPNPPCRSLFPYEVACVLI